MAIRTDPLPTPPLQRRPLSPVAARLLARAEAECKQQRFEAAERSLAAVLALVPHDPRTIRALGMVAQRLGNHARAIECLREVLPVWPDDPDLHMGLGISLHERGDADGAIKHLQRACRLAPGSPSAWFNLGKALHLAARPAETAAASRRALELDPSRLPARLLLSQAQANLGRIDAAVAGFRGVLQRDPNNAEAWFGLSNLNTVRFDAADTAHIERALARGGLSARECELLGFTFAKALECQGDYARAFDVFGRANASRRRRVNWDSAKEHDLVDAIQRAFTGPARPQPHIRRGHEAILIVSIPRSGSSLVEQILASHTEVEGANEINDMTQVIDAESRRRGSAFPAWVAEAGAEDWQRLGNEYLARTAHWRGTKPRFTDKSLMTWHVVGAALEMLPAARVVVVRRDPVETCLGCYRQLFGETIGFACGLDEIADYCIDFLRLARFWLDRYPGRVFDLEYEALVADPESVIRRLLDFCGLPFQRTCLEFHKTARTVLSLPSAAQVRQPLQRSTARSALYGSKLDHLRQRLRVAGVLAQ